VSPEDSKATFQLIQQHADDSFDKLLPAFWLQDGPSGLRNAFRLAFLAVTIGTGNDNMFVYTCKYGWIDHGHFLNNAILTYSWTRLHAEVLSALNELLQKLGKSDSAYTPEDLISNQLGRDFGAMLFWKDLEAVTLYRSLDLNPFTPIPKNVFEDPHFHWFWLLKSSGAVKWNQRTLPLYAAETFRRIQRTGISRRFCFLLATFCALVMSSSGCERTSPKDTKGKFPEDSVRKFIELVQAKDYEAAERLWYGESQLVFQPSDTKERAIDLRDKFEDFCAYFMQIDLATASISKARKGKSGFWMVSIDWTEGGEKRHYSFGLKIVEGEWKMERGYSW
jgi:hypothetical protein